MWPLVDKKKMWPLNTLFVAIKKINIKGFWTPLVRVKI